jgi:hypothetical protein
MVGELARYTLFRCLINTHTNLFRLNMELSKLPPLSSSYPITWLDTHHALVRYIHWIPLLIVPALGPSFTSARGVHVVDRKHLL